jgi:hypothetical protein
MFIFLRLVKVSAGFLDRKPVNAAKLADFCFACQHGLWRQSLSQKMDKTTTHNYGSGCY